MVFGAMVAAGLVWFIATYNVMVRLRQQVRESWSGIETELRRRYNLIPNLLETVKAYAAHERETLQAVTEARNRAVASTGSPRSQAKDENQLVGSLRSLLAVCEGYPDLSGAEVDMNRFLQDFNRRSRAVKIVFVNQFGWNRERCGTRMPSDMEFTDIRKGSDLEFGQSIYEPFGITAVESLTFGSLCVISGVHKVCECFSSGDSFCCRVFRNNFTSRIMG